MTLFKVNGILDTIATEVKVPQQNESENINGNGDANLSKFNPTFIVAQEVEKEVYYSV